MLDLMGQRYGLRPSDILGMSVDDPRSILLDVAIIRASAEREALASTVGGQIRASRAKWNPDIVKELREQGVPM
jgi:hypothetical protein